MYWLNLRFKLLSLLVFCMLLVSGCGGSGGSSDRTADRPPTETEQGDSDDSEQDNSTDDMDEDTESDDDEQNDAENGPQSAALLLLEQSLRDQLTTYNTDTDFTLMLESVSGHQWQHSTGLSTPDRVYESASSSKLVTATVMLYLVQQGTMSLTDHPQQYIPRWPTTGNLAQITLAQLLSLTSGLEAEPYCISPDADHTDSDLGLEECVEQVVLNNLSLPTPGDYFYYGSSHMQVAGLMAVYATESSSWGEVFSAFQTTTGLFPNARFDLPSVENPRLAGGMHWTAEEYMAFLSALYHGEILDESTLALMLQDYLANSDIKNSPSRRDKGEDWHYGLGFWIECPRAEYDCEGINRISSMGAYGAYPFIDFERGYFGLLARQGVLPSSVQAYQLMGAHRQLLDQWADLSHDLTAEHLTAE